MTLTLLFVLLMPCQSQGSPRDAYLEGWFAETASGDLDLALKNYRHCVDAAQSGDRDLKARALLRIALITRAQGNEKDARTQLDALVKDYAETAAAIEAQKALAGKPEDTSRESQAVAEARTILRELLLTPKEERVKVNVEGRMAIVLRTLSVTQMLEESERTKQSLAGLIPGKQGADFRDKLEELLRRGDDETAAGALRALARVRGWLVPAELLSMSVSAGPQMTAALFETLAGRADVESMHALVRLIRDNPNAKNGRRPDRTDLFLLMANKRPEVVDVFEAWRAQRSKIPDDLLHLSYVDADTPAGAWLRSQFPSLSATQRHAMASELIEDKVGREPQVRPIRRELLDMLLADAEPLVRQEALKFMIFSGMELGSEALTRSMKESIQSRAALMARALKVNNPPFSAAVLLDASEGVLREYVYHALLRPDAPPPTEDRHPVNVVRLGLDRGDGELLTAAFTPRFPREVNVDGRSGGALVWNNNSRTSNDSLQYFLSRVATAPEPKLMERFVRAASASSDVRMRWQLCDMVTKLPSRSGLEFYSDLAGGDVAAKVRSEVVQRLPFDSFSREVALALMADPVGSIADKAIERCGDAALLAEAAKSASVPRLTKIHSQAVSLNALDAIREIYHRTPPNAPLALECFRDLVQQDVTVAIDGLESASSTIRSTALNLLAVLASTPSTDSEAFAGFDSLTKVELRSSEPRPDLAQLLRQHLPQVQEAFRKQRIEALLAQLGGSSSQLNPRVAGEQLATLGAKDELIELTHGDGYQLTAAARGLAALGEKDRLLEALRTVINWSQFLEAVLDIGLAKDVVSMATDGGEWSRDLPYALVKHGEIEACLGLLLDASWVGRLPKGLTTDFDPVVRLLVDRGDATTLAKLVALSDWPIAVSALAQLKAYDKLLAGVREWDSHAQQRAVEEMQRVTGHPKVAEWPAYREDQEVLIATWAKDLGLANR